MCRQNIVRGCLSATLALLLLAFPVSATPPGTISGQIEATPESSRPELGEWEYILTMSWETGTGLGLLDFSLYLDDLSRGCSCDQLQAGVTPGDTVGFSHSAKTTDPVYYYAEFACEGDPALPVLGEMLVFRPFSPERSVPGHAGTGTYRIFSDFPPAPVAPHSLYLVAEGGLYVASGDVLGVFPALLCDPLPEQPSSWGALKSMYRR